MADRRDYTQEEKYAAAAHYYQFHNMKRLERDLNIPVPTVQGWRETIWWDDLTKQVIKDTEAKTRSRGLEIIEKAQEEILDRLVNGDVVVSKVGTLIRKPVALRDALFTFLTTFDKNRIINMQPTKVTSGTEAVVELQRQLREIGEAVKGKAKQDKVLNPLPDLPEAKEG